MLAFSKAINARLAAVGERAAPDLAQLALTLTPEQIARMQRKLASDNSKARRELVQFAGKETLDDRVKKYAERADFWFGSLTREQLELVRASLAKRPDSAGWWLDERERRQRELIAVVQRIQAERPNEEVAAGWLRAYFAQLQLPADPERRARVIEFRAVNAELVAQLVNAATAEQKSKLASRLASFAQDFVALASERIVPRRVERRPRAVTARRGVLPAAWYDGRARHASAGHARRCGRGAPRCPGSAATSRPPCRCRPG